MNIVDHALANEALLKKIRELRDARGLATSRRFSTRPGLDESVIVTFLDLNHNSYRDLVTCASIETAAKVINMLALAAVEKIDADMNALLEKFNRPLIEGLVTGAKA